MSVPFRTLGPTELLPRYVFAEPLFLRRRVLEVGAVASTAGASGAFLRTRGARTVLACDDDAEAVTAASAANQDESLRYRACVFEDLEPGSFDLLLVADLAPYVRAPGLLAELLRLRAPHGHLVAGLRNPAGLSLARLGEPERGEAPPTFGQALDALSAHLPSVEVATQAAVLGYQLAFERGEGLQVDGTLGGPGEVAYYVLVAGDAPAQRCEPVWVQLPPEPLAYAGGRVESQVAQRDEAQRRARSLAVELAAVKDERDAALEQRARLQGALDGASAEAGRLLGRVGQLESAGSAARGMDVLSLKVRQLEQSLAAAETARAEAVADAERAHTAERRALEAAAEWTRDAESSRRREQVLAEQMRTGLAALEATRAEREALVHRAARLEEEAAATRAGSQRLEQEAAAERARAAEAASLRAERDEFRRKVARLEEEVASVGASVPAGALEALRTEREELRRKVARLEQENILATAAPRSASAEGHAERRALGPAGDAASASSLPPAPLGQEAVERGWAGERARLEARILELETALRERSRAHDALSRTREETEARFQNSEQALRALREALDAAAAQGR